jgi:hypothetical protein
MVYIGDVEELGLSFEADENIFGKVESHELKYVRLKMINKPKFYTYYIYHFLLPIPERKKYTCY